MKQVRRIATQVDWDCEVKTLFREKNLGCRIGVSSAIDWFFENENIWHICGNNFGLRYEGKYESHCFGSFAQVWGWATWRDRWQQREMNPFYLEQLSSPEQWSVKFLNKLNKLVHLDKLKKGLDTWDYQWQITILNHSGLVVYPVANLISNIGDGLVATHTKRDDGRSASLQALNAKLQINSSPGESCIQVVVDKTRLCDCGSLYRKSRVNHVI
ncbi:MAG: hypothetical protein JRD93_22400 [Deltaproteobacteria bacterium]|nr:hypothetical protein [Deltaproteobacteria bacterium]